MSIITVSAGQCGNQVGVEFWKQLCSEHGLGADGTLLDGREADDAKDVFFYQSDDDHYLPRAVLLDTEPGVLRAIQGGSHGRLFNQVPMSSPLLSSSLLSSPSLLLSFLCVSRVVLAPS